MNNCDKTNLKIGSTINKLLICALSLLNLSSCYTYSESERQADEKYLIDLQTKYSEKRFEENLAKMRIQNFQNSNDTTAIRIEKEHLERIQQQRKAAQDEYLEEKNQCNDNIISCIINNEYDTSKYYKIDE